MELIKRDGKGKKSGKSVQRERLKIKSKVKGIVSRDWAELDMISMDRLEVFSIVRSYCILF